MAAPPSSLASARQSFLSLCATLAPCLIPPAGCLTSSMLASRRQQAGVLRGKRCAIRSGRRLLPSLDFIAMSLGLFLQLAGQSDLWLPLLISVGFFPRSPRQICFSCGLFKGLLCHPCCCLQSRRLRLENGGGKEGRGMLKVNGPAFTTSCCSKDIRAELGANWHGTVAIH